MFALIDHEPSAYFEQALAQGYMIRYFSKHQDTFMLVHPLVGLPCILHVLRRACPRAQLSHIDRRMPRQLPHSLRGAPFGLFVQRSGVRYTARQYWHRLTRVNQEPSHALQDAWQVHLETWGISNHHLALWHVATTGRGGDPKPRRGHGPDRWQRPRSRTGYERGEAPVGVLH